MFGRGAASSAKACMTNANALEKTMNKITAKGPLLPFFIFPPPLLALKRYTVRNEGALCRGDIFFNVFHLFIPAAAVHLKRFQATRQRDIVKAGFNDAQQGAALGFLQLEYDQRGRFVRIVN